MFPVIRNAPGAKDGRCVWLTTYHHYSAVVTKTRSLNCPGPLRAYMACWGTTYHLCREAAVEYLSAVSRVQDPGRISARGANIVTELSVVLVVLC